MNIRLPFAVFLSVLAVAACSSGAPHHARAAAHSSAPANPACPAVLAQIPPGAPATAHQAGAVSRDLPGPAPRGSLLFALANAVGTDALHLVFDLTGLRGSTAADLAAYESDVTALRRYCKTGS